MLKNDKYELTDEIIEIGGKKLYRIRALKDFSDVKAGDLGGFIEGEHNLSTEGDCWVYDNARVCDDAKVSGNAKVYDYARIYGDAKVFGNAEVYEDAKVFGNAKVPGDAKVFGNAKVSGNCRLCGKPQIFGNSFLSDNTRIFGNAFICDTTNIIGNASVKGNARIFDNNDFAAVIGFGTECRTTTFFRCADGKVRVCCGCFYGTIPEFRAQVKVTREGLISEEYLAIADLMEKHFK